MTIYEYTFGSNPNLVPICEEQGVSFPIDGDAVVAATGEDPESEEITVCQLDRAWQGHQEGDVVVVGMTVHGHPFWVIPAEEALTS